MKTIRWGIIGPGRIAHNFAKSVKMLKNTNIHAVGSRSLDRAKAFADEYGIEKAYGSYHELVQDPDLDAVYIATPHTEHHQAALLALKAGKAVLCEKPLCVNAREAEEMIRTARDHRAFLMEAMWTRLLPAMAQVRRLLAEGVLGDIHLVKADFSFRTGWEPESRLLNPELAGGALLDVGIYTLAFASMVLGDAPSSVTGKAFIGSTGVDERNAVILQYPEGGLAMLNSAVRTETQHEAWIIGTNGRLYIPEFWHASELHLQVGDKKEILQYPFDGSGFQFEIEEANRCLREGLIESPALPADESLKLMQIMDRLRAEWGVVYPSDAAHPDERGQG